MGVDGGFNDGSFLIDSTWFCWAIDLSNAFNSSAKRLLMAILIVTKPSCRGSSPTVMVENIFKRVEYFE
jgi:hypothetical protein